MTTNSETLTEIKKNQCGKGLLIENDGFISMNEYGNKKICEDIESSKINGEWHCPYPFVVDAVFQKYGIKNANGRIYPEGILKKQVEVYQNRINEKRAMGECYSDDVMVLTESGWKNIGDIHANENILTLNVESGEIEINPVIRKIEYEYEGEMIRIKNKYIDDLVTHNHKFPLFNEDGKFKDSFSASNIFDGLVIGLNKSYIPTNGIFKSEEDECQFGKYFNNVTDKIWLDDITEYRKEIYHGKVMCLDVDNHTFYVMSNGKCHWTSNCNHPETSNIDLGRVSHNIVELHWEGRTLVGKMELNITQGYVKYGIISSLGDTVANLLLNGYKIGVSSRGVGSVEQDRMGNYVVGDDFELICWDVVENPSTPNAYIGSSHNELQPYIESEVKKNGLIIDKVDKIKTILNS